MLKKSKKFISYSNIEKKLFFEALFYIFYSKFYLLFVSYKTWSKKLEFDKISQKPSEIELWELKKAILRANKFSFWKNKCLVMSFTSKLMLNRRNIDSKLHLGLKKENNLMLAHSWVQVDGINFISSGESYVKIA